MNLLARLFAARRRRRRAQDLSAYAALIAAPDDLGSAADLESLDDFVVPARAELAISFDEAVEAGDVVVTVDGRDMEIPALEADAVHSLQWAERGHVVSVGNSSAPACAATLHVLDQWRRPSPIATGDLT